MSKATVCALAASVLLAACQPPVKTVRIDSAALRGEQRVSSNHCGFRLKNVVDARNVSADAGGIGFSQLKVEDAPGVVRTELLKSGLLPPEAAQGRDVEVSLRQFYLSVSSNGYTKVPVVVYSVKAEGLADFVVRAQPSTMFWTGGEDSALASVSRALHFANLQLMASLDKACPA